MKSLATRVLSGLLVGVLSGSLCVLPCATAFAQAPPPGAEAPAMAQVRAGDAFMQGGQYREAAQQYEQAYAIDPDPSILERLAQAYRASGDLQRAAVLEQRLATMRGAPPPAYEQPPPPVYVPASPLPPVYTYTRPRLRPGQQLLNSGIGLLVAGYAMSIVGGAITMGATYTTNASYSWYGAGGMLFIPLAGPFATSVYRQDIWWSVPWAVIDGGMQLAGLAMAIAGGVIRASHQPGRRTADIKPLPFAVAPYSTQNGGGLTLRMQF